MRENRKSEALLEKISCLILKLTSSAFTFCPFSLLHLDYLLDFLYFASSLRILRPPQGDVDNRVRAVAKYVFGLQTVMWTTELSGYPIQDYDANDFCLRGLCLIALMMTFGSFVISREERRGQSELSRLGKPLCKQQGLIPNPLTDFFSSFFLLMFSRR